MLFTSLQNIVILSTIVIVPYVPVSKGYKSIRDIRPLYLCDFLENRFCGHGTFVLQTVEIRQQSYGYVTIRPKYNGHTVQQHSVAYFSISSLATYTAVLCEWRLIRQLCLLQPRLINFPWRRTQSTNSRNGCAVRITSHQIVA